jgi:SAM-dependent methyltransferase
VGFDQAPAGVTDRVNTAALRAPRKGCCPLCGGPAPDPFVDLGTVPANCSSFKATAAESRNVPAGSIRLAFCPACGYIYNVDFDESVIEYDNTYNNSLNCSATFRAFEEDLSAELIERWQLDRGRIIDIGCGKGEFLSLLCRLSNSTGVGFDPSWSGGPTDAGVQIVPSVYDETTAVEPADLVCCRHVLEHLEDPVSFAALLRRALNAASGLYIEVPNAGHVLGSDDLWDIIYPHRSYFAAPSLERLITDAEISVLHTTVSFGGQFLSLYGSATAESSQTAGRDQALAELAGNVRTFASRLSERIARSAALVGNLRRAGKVAALWGAGARGVTFLNVVPGAADIDLVVDSNPRKAGLHVPGTGQVVVSPDEPALRKADSVMIMNPMYLTEITDLLRQARSAAQVVVV